MHVSAAHIHCCSGRAHDVRWSTTSVPLISVPDSVTAKRRLSADQAGASRTVVSRTTASSTVNSVQQMFECPVGVVRQRVVLLWRDGSAAKLARHHVALCFVEVVADHDGG